MKHSIARTWLVVTFAGMGGAACTTGVDDAFTGTFTGPAASGPQQVTTFGSDTGDTETGDGPGTMGGSSEDGADTTMGATTDPDPTNGTTTFPDPTNGSTTDPGGCNPPCVGNDMCVDGVCMPPACNDVPGNYSDCLGPGGAIDVSGCGDPAATCVNLGMPPIAGVCAVTPCVDTCDCPFAPPTGNAPITCGPLTGGQNLCYLSCAAGQACPNGMECVGDQVCLWPGDGANGTPYGDCFNNEIANACGLGGICLNDDVAAPSVGVCTEPCANVGACPAAPPGGTAPVTCQDVTGDGANECVIDCSFGSCPNGMTCFGGFLCMWN